MREVYRLQQLHLWHPHAFLLYEQQQKWNYNFITARYFKHFLFTSFWYSIRKGSILFLMVTVVFNKKKMFAYMLYIRIRTRTNKWAWFFCYCFFCIVTHSALIPYSFPSIHLCCCELYDLQWSEEEKKNHTFYTHIAKSQ